MAQVVTASGGNTVNLTAATNTCLNQTYGCYLATGVGSTINSNGQTVSLETVDGVGSEHFGAQATQGGMINLTDGGTIAMNAVFNTGYGLWANGSGTINGNNLSFSSPTGGVAAQAEGRGGGAAQVTLSGTTTLTGSGQVGVNGAWASGNALVTFQGPLNASGPQNAPTGITSLGTAYNGGRIAFNGGGTLNTNLAIGDLFRVGFTSASDAAGTIIVNGLNGTINAPTVTASGASIAGFFGGGGTISFADSVFTANNGGTSPYFGIVFQQTQNAANLATLDNSTITLQSVGYGILADGGTGTVTLTNNSAITGFGTAANSLARVVERASGSSSLTLNATDSTLTGNVEVSYLGNVGTSSTFTATLDGTTTWTGNLTGSGAAASSTVTLQGTSQWNGNTTLTNANAAISISEQAQWTGNVSASASVFLSSAAISLDGAAQWTGNVSAIGFGAVVDVTLAGTSTWTGLATNANNVTVGAGTTWNVTGDSTLTGTLTNSGTVATAAGAPITLAAGGVQLAGVGIFDTGADLTLTGVVAGAGALTKIGTGSLTLTGNNTYTGPTNVNAGTLVINGNQAAATGLVTVNNGATLAGGEGTGATSGTIGGSVVVNSGGTLLSQDTNANGVNKVTVLGDFTLNSGGNLNYFYEVSPTTGNTNVLQVQVGGTATLNAGGNVNVTNGPGVVFDQQIYGLMQAGSMAGTAAGLNFTGPAGYELNIHGNGLYMQVAAPVGTFNYWDGSNTTANNRVDGGTGTWQASGSGLTNWTTASGDTNGGFTDASSAVFMTTGGVVTVDNSAGAINVSGMSFVVDGYTLTGNEINLVPDTNPNNPSQHNLIAVGVGNPGDEGISTTINSVLTGTATLEKRGLGTLVLNGANTYTGGTEFSAGVVQVAADANLGAAAGGLTFDGGILRVTGTAFNATPRTITWGDSGGGFDIADAANTFTVSQNLTNAAGSSELSKYGAGTLVLSGTNTYAGGTEIYGGTLSVSSVANLGTGGLTFGVDPNNPDLTRTLQTTGGTPLNFTQTVALNANGIFDTGADLTLAGVVSGAGSLTKTNSGTLTLSGANTYAGGTFINGGTVSISATGNLGTGPLTFGTQDGLFGTLQTTGAGPIDFAGSVTMNADGTFNTGADLVLAGPITGPGDITKTGAANLILTADSSYSGNVAVNQGQLWFGNGTAAGSINGNVALAAGTGLVFDRTTNHVYGGVISGAGAVTQQGTGAVAVTGNNTYSGGTTIATGSTLQVGNGGGTGTLGTGPVANAGSLIFNRNNTLTMAAAISGAGSVTQAGSGTTVFDAGVTNSYTGPTTINNGTLQVDGPLTASNVTVNAAGTLSGFGTLGGTVNNLGNIMPGHGDAAGALTLTNAYTGNGGRLTINTELGGDASPTSQLVLSGATASATGNTSVIVNNKGGTGAQTGTSGIPIIVATGGATTAASAFSLGNRVAAGLYDYQLFRGPDAGGTADEQNSWYLRSHIAGPGPNPIPLFRPEGAMYGAMASLGRELMRTTIGTFHDYNGDEAVLRGSIGSGRGWGRVFGEAIEQKHGGLLSPSFKGRAYGFQSGFDLWQSETPDGFHDRIGVFVTYARATGDVNGYALGIFNAAVGDVGLDSLGGGAYWTRLTPTDGYVEARFIGAHYSGDGTSSINRQNISVNGKSFAGSLEAGQPFNFGNGIVIEPQAQVIYQYMDMIGRDPFATLTYDTPNALYARVGLRASSDSFFGIANVRPYLKANIWQDVVGTDKVAFSAVDVVDTDFRATALEVGGGIVAQLTPSAAIWGMVDYTTDIAGGQERQIIRGNAGMKLTW